MTKPPADQQPAGGPYGCVFVGAVVLAVLGALVVPVYGLLSVMKSDVCGPDSAAYFCSGDGQAVAFYTGVAGGPGALLVGLVAAAVLRRARPWWPYAVLAAQLAAVVVVSAVSSRVD